MNHRFRLQRGLGWNGSRPGHPLTEGVFSSNIDDTLPGIVRVALGNDWRTLLDDLRKVGPVWSMVRNGHALLAVQGEYPELRFSIDQGAAGTFREDQSLICYFRDWHRASALETSCCCGKIYGVEIEDRSGVVLHKICLAKGTDIALFMQWTQAHQATGLELPSTITGENSLENEFFSPGVPVVGCARSPSALVAQRPADGGSSAKFRWRPACLPRASFRPHTSR